jgi:branched-chain amino acid transport system ATP-binding protein
MMSDTLLSVDRVASGYGHLQVLHNVSFDLERNSVTAIIGPNGHGKSTLLRAISGLNRIWSGSIVFDGHALQTDAPSRARSGLVLVPQGDQLFMSMTIEENLMMGAFARRSMAEAPQALDRVYALFPKLKVRRHQYANSLSGGERRMVGIGRGMMADAKLMMIDEPSLGLAPLIIEQIYDALGELAKAGASILVVEENPSRVAGIASAFHLVDGGQITWSGTADELKTSGDILKTYLGG